MSRPTLLSTLLAGILLVGVVASSSTPVHALGRQREMKERLVHEIDSALAAVKATPQQREQVRAAVGEVLRTAGEAFGSTGQATEVDELLRIFGGEHLDDRALSGLRNRRDAKHGKLGDALMDAFDEIHGALSREQRQQLTDYARGKAQGKHMKAFQEKMMSGLVNAQVEDVLDQLGASEAERQAARQTRDVVLGALQAARADKDARMDHLASLFRDDTVDRASLQRFRSESDQQVRALMDAVQQAVRRLHDGLSPAHRQQLVQLVRDRRARHRAVQAAESSEGF